MVKRTGAARASKHTKKYWRKGADVADVEKSLAEASFDRRDGGAPVHERANDDLFTLDTQQNEAGEGPKGLQGLTKRKQAILERIGKRVDEPLPSTATFPKKKIVMPKTKRGVIKQKTPAKMQSVPTKFDLWNTDLTAKVEGLNDEEGAEHLLKTLKLKRVNVPRSMKKKPSALRAVAIPDAGASYNPDVQDFQGFMTRLGEDELKLIKKEEKDARREQLPEGTKYCTEAERHREMMQGLGMLEEEKEAEDEMEVKKDEDDKMEGAPAKLSNKPKTKKQRRKEKEVKIANRERERIKGLTGTAFNVFRAKKIVKDLKASEDAHSKELKERWQQRTIKDMTERKKLGRGKFVEPEEAFLLAEELPGSIRALKPQGSLVEERLVSLQKRNMIPIAGDKNKHKLKTRLKSKWMETRASKEVKIGTRVI